MKKIVTMFVMMTAILSVSCTADTGESSNTKHKKPTSGTHKALTINGGGSDVIYDTTGIAPNKTVTEMGDKTDFLVDFVTKAKAAYATGFDEIKTADVTYDAITDTYGFKDGVLVTITLRVTATDIEVATELEYTTTPTDDGGSVTPGNQIADADIDYTDVTPTTIAGLTYTDKFNIANGSNGDSGLKVNAEYSNKTTGAELATAIETELKKIEITGIDHANTRVVAAQTGEFVPGETIVKLTVTLKPTTGWNFAGSAVNVTKNINLTATVTKNSGTEIPTIDITLEIGDRKPISEESIATTFYPLVNIDVSFGNSDNIIAGLSHLYMDVSTSFYGEPQEFKFTRMVELFERKFNDLSPLKYSVTMSTTEDESLNLLYIYATIIPKGNYIVDPLRTKFTIIATLINSSDGNWVE